MHSRSYSSKSLYNHHVSRCLCIDVGNSFFQNLQPNYQPDKEAETTTVSFPKVNGSMGLSIVAAQGIGREERGIYIKSVVTGGAAALVSILTLYRPRFSKYINSLQTTVFITKMCQLTNIRNISAGFSSNIMVILFKY